MKSSIEPNQNLKDAGVIVPIYRNKKDNIIVILIRRTQGGLHSGQLAFPGGKRNTKDKTILETAIREAKEEIGLFPNSIKILENLPVVDVQATRFRIYPFLAKIVPPEKWNRQEEEIAEILEVNIQEFTRPNVHSRYFHNLKGWPKPKLISFYRVGQYRLWGATYRILHPLLPRLLAGEWKL